MQLNLNIFDEHIDKILNMIPFEIATYHPYIVHFAVALPLVSLIFQGSKKAELHKAANILYFTGIAFILFAFFSGKATVIEVQGNIGSEGLTLLGKHTDVATYIVLSYLSILVLKLLYLIFKNDSMKSIVTFLMYGAGLLILWAAKTGHDLVYIYGAGLQVGE